MADTKISALPSGAPAQTGDEYVIARAGANYKLTLSNIAASMPPIGATTPNTGAFTTLSVSGMATFAGSTQITGTGSVGLGATPAADTKFLISAALPTTGAASYAARNLATFPSGATSTAVGFDSGPSTEAAAFTVAQLIHFNAGQGTIGAGSTVTSQFGFVAQGNLTGATNNFGFYGNIASGSNRWNFYAAGTATNYFEGAVGVGGVPSATTKVRVGGTYPTSGNVSRAVVTNGTVPSGTTDEANGFQTIISTQAASFTLNALVHFQANQGTIGAGSAITNQYGFIATGLTGATNNFGYYSNIGAASNRWNFYANGSARNYFEGRTDVKNTRIEATTTWNGVHIDATAAVSVEDGATVTLTSAACGAVIVHVYDETTGEGGVFFATYNTIVTKIAGDGEATDTGSTFAVYKSAANHTLTLKNRYGGSARNFRVALFAAQAA